MKKTLLLWGTLAICTFSFAQTEVFINEIHYDDIDGDTNEGVEIAGPAGTDLTGWRLVFYNGNGGVVQNTQLLFGIIPDEQNNRGVIWFPHATTIQNDMEGIALIDPLDKIIQFLSYEGSFIAADGLANGMTSIDIVVLEDGTATNESLQLTGSGTYYEDFTWATSANATREAINNNQTFTIAPAILSNNYIVSSLNYEVGSGPSNEGSFIIEGSNLTNDIIINSLADFEISETSGGSFSVSITLLNSAGTVDPTTIYVRLKTGQTIGNYSHEGLISSIDAMDKNISLNGIVSPNFGSIIITEIMQDPNIVSNANGEYFEVYNTTATDIDLQGWIISDAGSESHTISSSVIVPSGGYAVLARDSDIGVNGGFTANYEFSGFILANSVDEIILTSGVTEIDRVDYNATTFPYMAGASMELHSYKYNAVSNDTGSNWGTATTAYGAGDMGTPGTNNEFGLSVVKNEIENFVMYPNPASNGILNMSSCNNANKQVEIYAITGQQVFSKNVQLRETMNLSNLKRGIYFVKIEEEGKVATRKLIVN